MGADDVISVRSLQRWQGPHGEVATTLSATEYSCAQRSARLFMELPNGRRWVLESVVFPEAGMAHVSIKQDSGHWKIAVMDHFEGTVHVPRPTAFGDVLFWQKVAQAGPIPRQRRLSVGGTDRWTASAPGYFVGEDRLEESFSPELLGSFLAQEAPEAVRADLRTLQTFADTPAAARGALVPFVPLLRLIGKSLGGPELQAGEEAPLPTWTAVDTQASTGGEVSQPTEWEFLRRFSSLADPRDPLQGLHAPPDGGCDES